MKLVPRQQDIFLTRIRSKPERRKNKHIQRRKRRKHRLATRQYHKSKELREQYPDSLIISAPMYFRLLSEPRHNGLLLFLNQLRNELVLGDPRKPIVLDFTDTRKMWSEGTLLFKAELARALRIASNRRAIKCIPPESKKVAQVLKQVGIYELLRFDSRIIPSADDVVKWKHAQGCEVEGEKYDEVLGSYIGTIPDRLASKLYVGITEAMTNCHNHAYIIPRADGLKQENEPKDWWMFSQEKDGLLSVAFCDLGAGIPGTLSYTRPGVWRRIMSLGRDAKDAEIISEAIEDSKTRTGKAYRGKGLKQLVASLEQFEKGRLVIISNKGCYDYSDGEPTLSEFQHSILGTLILWTLPIHEG